MKRLLLLFAAILMASTGMWAETVDYLYPVYNTDGVPTSGIKEWKTASVDATVVTDASEPVTWTAGWYVVKGSDVTLSQGAICSGEVHLILADGAKLTATGATYRAGIQVSGEGNSLTIYGQTAQTGQLIANGGEKAAGIGGGEFESGSNITINGGMVTANGGDYAAGIGGGEDGDGSNITINRGTVTATGGEYGAGIGGGADSSGSNITINGGTVIANGGYNASGIGGSGSSDIFVATWCIVKAGSSITPDTEIATNRTSKTDIATNLVGQQYVTTEPNPNFAYVAYIDEQGEEQHVYAKTITSSDSQVTWGDDWYVVTGADVTLSQGAICYGDVRLILADGAKLTATGGAGQAGITVSGEGNSLTIYDQTAQSGQLEANGGNFAAGIGGGNNTIALQHGNNITINGGLVTANGGLSAAGIGGGYYGPGYNITINGGTVTANGGGDAAGIGGGHDGKFSSSNIFVATWCIVKAGNSEEIAAEHTSTTDLAESLKGEQYVTVEIRKSVVIFDNNITVSPAFTSGTEIPARTQITFTAADPLTGYDFFGFFEESDFNTQITTGVSGRTYTTTVMNAPISVYARYDCNQSVSASYVYPVYNDPTDVTKGVKEWGTETVNALVVASSDIPVTWGEAGKTTWYVVTGEDVILSKGAVCAGNVNLILADGAKLTAKGYIVLSTLSDIPGIQVSGGHSLAIYGQTAQSGQLEAQSYSSGIGGGDGCEGSNITINGGTVTAKGGSGAAGIGGGYQGTDSNITINGGTVTAYGGSGGDGIGGGEFGSGSNITINGGTVTANGGVYAAGIGGGYLGTDSKITINGGTVTANGGQNASGIGGGFAEIITVATYLIVKADGNNPPTTVIENNHSDLAESLAGKQYATITEPYFNITANQDPDDETHYYSTFYSRTCDYQVPSGVTAYTGEVDGSVLKLTAIESGIIPAGEAVILRLTTEEDITATKKQLTLTATTTSATKSTDNKLSGTDVATTLGANQYALSLGQKGVGFYLWEGKEIAANKAYLELPASSAKALAFEFEETTSIHGLTPALSEGEGAMYNLNGMRVDENYKGIVIKNGKKVLKNE